MNVVVQVQDLTVTLTDRKTRIVDGASFSVAEGEILGVVGESGSGKTTLALAVLGYARAGTVVTRGDVLLDGRSMLGLGPSALRRRRGRDVAYVAQDPAAALNPALRIETQLTELLDVHTDRRAADPAQEAREIAAVMEDVRLPTDREFLRRYPHELSGGERQRVAIAMAALLRPKVIVMDEPTTGLDVTTQAHVLRTVRLLCDRYGVAVLYVSHDLAVVSEIADRTLVMYSGRVIELGGSDVLRRPAHPYTRGLMGAVPTITRARRMSAIPGTAPSPADRPAGCTFAPRCAHALGDCVAGEPALASVRPGHLVRCIRADEIGSVSPFETAVPISSAAAGGEVLLEVRDLTAAYGRRPVVHGVTMEVRQHECLALVGGSGSGKTTISRSIVGLTAQWGGEMVFRGESLRRAARDRPRELRRAIHYVFQNPYGSLNPRKTIGESVGAPLRYFFGARGREVDAQVAAALEQVALTRNKASRYPDELSGGERQRAAIARALVCRPQVLICDEITSSLDVSAQATIVTLLDRLRREDGIAVVFVTHNLALIRSVADRALVLDHGRVVEQGTVETLLTRPVESYTRTLLADTPDLDRILVSRRSH